MGTPLRLQGKDPHYQRGSNIASPVNYAKLDTGIFLRLQHNQQVPSSRKGLRRRRNDGDDEVNDFARSCTVLRHCEHL